MRHLHATSVLYVHRSGTCQMLHPGTLFWVHPHPEVTRAIISSAYRQLSLEHELQEPRVLMAGSSGHQTLVTELSEQQWQQAISCSATSCAGTPNSSSLNLIHKHSMHILHMNNPLTTALISQACRRLSRHPNPIHVHAMWIQRQPHVCHWVPCCSQAAAWLCEAESAETMNEFADAQCKVLLFAAVAAAAVCTTLQRT
jgi:hypothetical protein